MPIIHHEMQRTAVLALLVRIDKSLTSCGFIGQSVSHEVTLNDDLLDLRSLAYQHAVSAKPKVQLFKDIMDTCDELMNRERKDNKHILADRDRLDLYFNAIVERWLSL